MLMPKFLNLFKTDVQNNKKVEPDAACYANTPSATVKDNRGLAVRALRYNRVSGTDSITSYISRNSYSAAGYPLTQADPRLFAVNLTNFDEANDLLGQPLRVDSRDAGSCWTLRDIEGRLIWQCDGRGTLTYWRYDLLGRVLTISEQLKSDDPSHSLPLQVRERFIYGDIAG